MNYLNLDNSVRNTERYFLINQGAVTVEYHNQLKNVLRNRERIRAIRKHPLIHATLIISVLNVMVGDQIRVLDEYQRITSS